MTTAAMNPIERSAALVLGMGRFLLIAAFALMLIAALHPNVRSQVRGTFIKDYRMVVSTAQGDLLGDGSLLTVAKVKTSEALLIEVYRSLADGSQQLVERIEMPDKKDGYFTFNGQATNLVIDDIDGDGQREILAPSFDQNLVGHLNVYRYNQGERGFQRMLR